MGGAAANDRPDALASIDPGAFRSVVAETEGALELCLCSCWCSSLPGTWWAIAAATADSRPIIVRGHIQTNGDEVWVTVNQRPKNEIEPPISFGAVRTKGDFVLRGEMPAAAARELVLYVEPTDYVPVSCGTQELPSTT